MYIYIYIFFLPTKKTQVSEVIFCGIPQKFRLTWICVVGDIFYGSYQGEITPLNPPFGEDVFTLPETNIAPENGWLEYYFPIGEPNFQGLR